MSQIVKEVNSIHLNSFEPGHKQIPVNLSSAESDQLKLDLKPHFNALIQNTVFKKKFTTTLSPSSSEIPINITISGNSIIVINKTTNKTSTLALAQDSENASLNAIIARIFKIAKNALPKKEEPKSPVAEQSSIESRVTPPSSKPLEEPDLLDVSQLSSPNDEDNQWIPASSNTSALKAPKNSSLQSILNLYDTPTASANTVTFSAQKDPIKPKFHLREDGVPKSERPYLEDIFYDLPKKEKAVPVKNAEKHNALSDINAFNYLQELEHSEKQKQIAIQADLTVTS